jgi:hypothetical protein
MKEARIGQQRGDIGRAAGGRLRRDGCGDREEKDDLQITFFSA